MGHVSLTRGNRCWASVVCMKPRNQCTLVLLSAPGFMVSLQRQLCFFFIFIFFIKSSGAAEVRQSGRKYGKLLVDMNMQPLFPTLNAWMDGALPSSYFSSSSCSPLKPGCRLLIQCSYINMLSSRGQRWAHRHTHKAFLLPIRGNKEMYEDAK